MKKTRIQNQSYLRQINQQSVISALREQEMSCSALAKKTGLSNTAIANITDELVQHGLLSRSGNGRDSGRRPVVMSINPDAASVAIMELAGKDITLAVAALGGVIADMVTVRFSGKLTADYVDKLCLKLKALLSQHGLLDNLAAVCVSAPGKIDSETGYFLQAHRFSDCRRVNLHNIISRHFCCHIKIHNDLKLALTGERLHGTLLSGVSNALMLYIDHSVGSALLLDGKIYGGTHGFAGEISNFTADASASPLNYLKPGTRTNVQALSFDGLIDNIKDAVRAGQPTLLKSLCGDADNIDLQTIIRAYELCDPLTENIITGFISVWSVIIKNIAEFLDLQSVVLSGAVTKLGSRFLNAVSVAVNSELKHNNVAISYSQLGAGAPLAGAVHTAIGVALNDLLSRI